MRGAGLEVIDVSDYTGFPEMMALDQIVSGAPIAFRASSSAAQQSAVAAGLGLGVLHLFAADADDRLVRLLPGEAEVWRSYWLVIHADLQRLPRVRAVVDWLDTVAHAMRERL